MTSWTSTRIRNTGQHINIAPGADDLDLGEPEQASEDFEEPSILAAEDLEAECVPFLASRAVFLPICSGEARRRMRFLAVPLQMLFY